jgi:hypothetical protein
MPLTDVKLNLSGLLLSAAASFENLVVAPHSLMPGQSYRARLTATTATGSSSAEILFTVNMPPVNGTLSVLPRTGMSLVDRFTLQASGWQDEDFPLSFRFFVDTPVRSMPLNEASVNSTVVTLLPPCIADASPHNVTVAVTDTFDATSTYVNTSVFVSAFQRASLRWENISTTHLSAHRSNVSVVQLLISLTANINLENASNTSDYSAGEFHDVAATRTILTTSLSKEMTQTTARASLSAVAIGEFASCLELITITPPQLKNTTVEYAIDLLEILSVAAESVAISSSVASSLSHTASALIVAANRAKEGTLVATTRVQSVITSISRVSIAVGSGLLSGQQPAKLRTPTFVMEIAQVGITRNDSLQPIAAVMLPHGLQSQTNLTDTILTQVIVWSENPFSFVNQTVAATIASEVLTINFFSSGKLLRVENLLEPIRVTITVDEAQGVRCDDLPCVNAYDLFHGKGSCDTLLQNGYRCDAEFCDDCALQGYCRRSCGSANCSKLVNMSTHCKPRPKFQCSYFDEERSMWQIDGQIMAMDASQISCGFSHLTSFAVLQSAPPQSNQLASLRDTLDVVGFFIHNPAGLIFVLGCFTLVFIIGVTNLVRFAKLNGITSLKPCGSRMQTTPLDVNQLLTSAYAVRVRKLNNDPASLTTRDFRFTKLRVSWSCGALFLPLRGDPHLRTERMLVLTCQIMLTLA